MSLALISEFMGLPNYIVLGLLNVDARPEAPRIFIFLTTPGTEFFTEPLANKL